MRKRPFRPGLKGRTSGVLLHPTCLPSRFGIGDIGPEARSFAGWLFSAGQSWWQMLPICPVNGLNSPYQSDSAFAGNPLLISPEDLGREGWLSAAELSEEAVHQAGPVRTGRVRRQKERLLRSAFARLDRNPSRRARFRVFCRREKEWLNDYALFSSLKEACGGDWASWEAPIRQRRPDALRRAARCLRESIRYHQWIQWQFEEQWQRLRLHCRNLGIGLIGDLPIFVAHDSADVWANQHLFWLDRQGRPGIVAGVPPDYFSKEGQLWGNPLYRWGRLKQDGYRWWLRRLSMMLRRFDVIRLDHFIGLHRYWVVSSSARTARMGRFDRGPGAHFLEAVRRELGSLPVIAEDLGTVTAAVQHLRERFDIPGMRVLQFAFGDGNNGSAYLPHNYPRRCVAYTGTHDNDTTVGWFRDRGSSASTRTLEQIRRERARALRYLGTNGKEIHWDMIRLALASVAETSIVPVQDLLGLGSEARMNKPGTVERNWIWRMRRDALSGSIQRRLRGLTELYGRLPLQAGRERTN